MSNRMPDENTNPIGSAQTPKNDQTTTNQTGGDFTLDFGGGEDENNATISEDMNLNTDLGDINNENVEGDSKLEVDLGLSDDSQEGENQENNINIQDLDSIFNEAQNEGFDISLDNADKDKQDEKLEQKNDLDTFDNKKQSDTDFTETETSNQDFTISLDDTVENKIETSQDNQENKIEETNLINFEEENEIEASQESSEETGNQNLETAQDDESEINTYSSEDDNDSLEANDSLKANDSLQGNDSLQVDNAEDIQSTQFEEEIENSVQETQEDIEDKSDETILNSNNEEDNTVNDNFSDSVEIGGTENYQQVSENIDEKNIGETTEMLDNGDVPSVSFDDEVSGDETVDNNSTTENPEAEINTEEYTKEDEISEEKSEIGDEEIPNTVDEGADVEDDVEEALVEETPSDKEISQKSNLDVDIEDKDATLNQEETPEIKDNEDFELNVNDTVNLTENGNNNSTEAINNENETNESNAEDFYNGFKIDDNNEKTMQSSTPENVTESKNQGLQDLDFALDFNLDEKQAQSTEQEIKQPEIGDLLGDEQLLGDSSNVTDTQNVEKENADNLSLEMNDDANQIISNEEVNSNNETINSENVDVNQNSQDFSLDYGNKGENTQEGTLNSNENTDAINNVSETKNDLPQGSESAGNQQIYDSDSISTSNNDNLQQSLPENDTNSNEENLMQNQANQVNDVSESMDSQNKEEDISIRQTEIATLSLDQILDSELNSNPQYADNSRAVPKNVQTNSGFFNKKTVGILAGILVLAGFVVMWVSPFKNIGGSTGDIEAFTGDEVEIQEHNAGDEPGEITGDYQQDQENQQNQGNQDIQQNQQEHTAGAKVITFPEDELRGSENIDDNTSNGTEVNEGPIILDAPMPYTCEGDDCGGETQPIVVMLTLEEVEPVISDFKEYAESYYSIGDETQDKKLVRYSLQIINSCNLFQESVEKEGSISQEIFEEFKSSIGELKLKVEKYTKGSDDIQIFDQSNYDFEGKDEIKAFLESENSY